MGNYTVQAGDTLGKIAQKFGISVNVLAQNNGIKNQDLIYAGQELEVGENKSNYDSFQYTTTPTNSTKSTNSTKASPVALKAESYNQYKERAGLENAEKIIEKYKGEALKAISMMHDSDYVPTEEELCDAVASHLMNKINRFKSADAIDLLLGGTPALLINDGRVKLSSPAEQYEQKENAARIAAQELKAILPKLSKNMQITVQAALDSANKELDKDHSELILEAIFRKEHGGR